MPEHHPSRRGLLRTAGVGVGVGAAATGLGLAATPVTASAADVAGTAASSSASSAVHNVRDFGAVGDGSADDTKAFADAVAAAAGGPVVLYVPAGTYVVTAFPDLADGSHVYGDGADASTIEYSGNSTLIWLRNKQRVRFSRLGIFLASGASATAIRISQCFRCSFEQILIRGNHSSDTYPTYVNQQGVVLDQNTGGTTFLDCDINNLGFGIVTSCIQNYVTACKLATNRVGVLGTGGNYSAGLAIANTEFVSDSDPNTTSRHLDIDGPANDWWLTGVWFEGAEVAITVGRSGVGGPSQFGMVNCKVAARTIGVDLQSCRQPHLTDVIFDADTSTPPTELRIDATNCPEGTAIGLISGFRDDIDPQTFPPAWQVLGRRGLYSNAITLRDGSGGLWRLAVAADGTLSTQRAN
jgi:Pectate lyase superfamily protein